MDGSKLTVYPSLVSQFLSRKAKCNQSMANTLEVRQQLVLTQFPKALGLLPALTLLKLKAN